ncbi:MAG: septum formation initiator family protein [Candidatus Babeliaceae bacterium]|jgi:cell division protein FtsL
MVVYKKFIIPLFLLVEIIFFGVYYVYAPHGLSYLIKFSQENNDMRMTMRDIQHDIEVLTGQVQDSTTFAYYKEKIAREQLQMMLPNEQVFYII